jgi:hypothetical protein
MLSGNGLSLGPLSWLAQPTPVGGTPIFTAGYEAGTFAEFSPGNTLSGSGAAAVNGACAVTGSYGGQYSIASATDTNDGAESREAQALPASGILALEFDFAWSAFAASGYNIAGSREVAAIHKDFFGSYVPVVGLTVVGTRQLQLSYMDRTGTRQLVTGTDTRALSSAVRYRIELDRTGSTGNRRSA